MQQLILCDIGQDVTFGVAGDFKKVRFDDIFVQENRDRIYRIQFHRPPAKYHLERVTELIKERPRITLRFYGQYREGDINWHLLRDIERLQVDLWETGDLHQLQYLPKLKELGILKQVKSKVSLKVLSTLPDLEVLSTSISKDVGSISHLKKLRFLSFREIKTKNLDFLQELPFLTDLWLSLGSIDSFEGIGNNTSLRNLRIHQVRGFNSRQADLMLTKGQRLNALALENLKHLTDLDFTRHLSSLRYLRLDGIKNVITYMPLENSHSIEKITTYNSKPQDESILPIRNIKQIWIGESYKKRTIEQFTKAFMGDVLYYRGKSIKGEWIATTPFDRSVF